MKGKESTKKFYAAFGTIGTELVYVFSKKQTETLHLCFFFNAKIAHTYAMYRNFLICLKGQCHEIFDFCFFFMNQFPPSP